MKSTKRRSQTQRRKATQRRQTLNAVERNGAKVKPDPERNREILSELSVTKLRELATDFGIVGRSRMTKPQLIEALSGT